MELDAVFIVEFLGNVRMKVGLAHNFIRIVPPSAQVRNKTKVRNAPALISASTVLPEDDKAFLSQLELPRRYTLARRPARAQGLDGLHQRNPRLERITRRRRSIRNARLMHEQRFRLALSRCP
jgi:hypothetical protein